MAFAEVIKQTVLNVTLKLSEDEARVLKQIMGHIGGSPINSPRKFADSINVALVDAGVIGADHSLERENKGIYFMDYQDNISY